MPAPSNGPTAQANAMMTKDLSITTRPREYHHPPKGPSPQPSSATPDPYSALLARLNIIAQEQAHCTEFVRQLTQEGPGGSVPAPDPLARGHAEARVRPDQPISGSSSATAVV